MNIEKLKLLVKGLIRYLPGVKNLLKKRKTGGTDESRYCYSIWMRHLINYSATNKIIPETVAELGPGDSLGTALAALLTGTKKIYALDVIKYWDNKRNLKIFEELVILFKNKANIPDNKEYPKIRPELQDYSFPSKIISDKILKSSLEKKRLDLIRKEIMDCNNPNNIFISYKIPWNNTDIISLNSIDFIYSQAVLECIDDLDSTFAVLHKWLKNNGYMSHTIDLKPHGLTNKWYGHWTFSNLEWKIIKGGRKFLVNRLPYSSYINLHLAYNFEILVKSVIKSRPIKNRNKLSKNFRNLSDEDLKISGLYILSKKNNLKNPENKK